MIIKLIRGTESVEMEGNDCLIQESMNYQGTCERKVSEVTKAFYAAEKRDGKEGA